MTWAKTSLGGMKQWRCRDSRGAFRIVHWSPKTPGVYRAQVIGVDGRLRTLGQAPTLSAAKALTAGAKANPAAAGAKYYVKPSTHGLFELRQTRFIGKKHPHDVMAVGTLADIQGMDRMLPGAAAAVEAYGPRKNPKAAKPLSKKALDKLIEQIYYKNASGLQIDIMDIGKVFKAGERAYASGENVEDAVKAAIKVYCKAPNPRKRSGKKAPARRRNPALDADDVLDGYLTAALWSSTNDNTGEPLDSDFSVDDIKGKTLAKLKSHVSKFLTAAKGLDLSGHRASRVGHDLWLTQNGHGAGFWDGDYEDPPGLGDKLSRIAKSLGEVYLYVGDDGKLYV